MPWGHVSGSVTHWGLKSERDDDQNIDSSASLSSSLLSSSSHLQLGRRKISGPLETQNHKHQFRQDAGEIIFKPIG